MPSPVTGDIESAEDAHSLALDFLGNSIQSPAVYLADPTGVKQLPTVATGGAKAVRRTTSAKARSKASAKASAGRSVDCLHLLKAFT